MQNFLNSLLDRHPEKIKANVEIYTWQTSPYCIAVFFLRVVYEKPRFSKKPGFFKKFLSHTKAEKRYSRAKLLLWWKGFNYTESPDSTSAISQSCESQMTNDNQRVNWKFTPNPTNFFPQRKIKLKLSRLKWENNYPTFFKHRNL